MTSEEFHAIQTMLTAVARSNREAILVLAEEIENLAPGASARIAARLDKIAMRTDNHHVAERLHSLASAVRGQR